MTARSFAAPVSARRKILMRVALPAALLLLALVASGSAAQVSVAPLSVAHVDGYAASLDALADEPSSAARLANATRAWVSLGGMVRDLDPAAADLLDAYHDGMADADNESDVRDLARAAALTARGDARAAVEAWEVHRTMVRPTLASAGGAGGVLRVELALLNPPAGGVGAFDVALHLANGTPVDAAVATGQGEATVDAANGTARIAAFDARALGGVGSAARPVALGHVDVRPDADGRVQGTARVLDVADAEGERVPAIGLGLSGHGGAMGTSGGIASNVRIGVAVAGVAGAGLLVAVLLRKIVKV